MLQSWSFETLKPQLRNEIRKHKRTQESKKRGATRGGEVDEPGGELDEPPTFKIVLRVVLTLPVEF